MMHTMMTWSIEDILKRSNGSHNFCMNPELVKCVKLIMDTENGGRYCQSQREIKELQTKYKIVFHYVKDFLVSAQ